MPRSVLTGIVLALTTGGLAFAGSVDIPQPDRQDQEAAFAGDTEEKTSEIGGQGEPASMVQEDRTAETRSNVESAGSERTGDAGAPASLVQ